MVAGQDKTQCSAAQAPCCGPVPWMYAVMLEPCHTIIPKKGEGGKYLPRVIEAASQRDLSQGKVFPPESWPRNGLQPEEAHT